MSTGASAFHLYLGSATVIVLAPEQLPRAESCHGAAPVPPYDGDVLRNSRWRLLLIANSGTCHK
jgi:hypothetical protein